MLICPNSNINFQSKIKFVSSQEFSRQKFNEHFYCSIKNDLNDSMAKSPKIWTHSIRTCTGGGIVDKQGALGFHFYDCIKILEGVKNNFADFIKQINNNNISALIIGSKRVNSREIESDFSNTPSEMKEPLSLRMFETVRAEINKFVSPSIFRTYNDNSMESDIGYSGIEDTWFINTNYLKHPQLLYTETDLLTLDALKSAFEEIKIAPQDRLFIDNKEITKDMCPEIFE